MIIQEYDPCQKFSGSFEDISLRDTSIINVEESAGCFCNLNIFAFIFHLIFPHLSSAQTPY